MLQKSQRVFLFVLYLYTFATSVGVIVVAYAM